MCARVPTLPVQTWLPATMARCPAITELDLSGNPVGLFPPAVAALQSLRTLKIT